MQRMRESPSLLSLCAKLIATEIIYGDPCLHDIFELPSDILDYLVLHLPPLALHKLHEESNQSSRHKFITGSIKDGRKRGRNDNFDMAWKAMFQSRWPGPVRQIQPTGCTAGQVGKTRHELKECLDWQQMYWEAHLQDCLDAAAEIALLPYFGGPIGEVKISDTIVNILGYKVDVHHSIHDYHKLSYHCQQFGHYVRHLRLGNVLCVSETCELFRDCKLQGLVLRGINSRNHVDGVCKLLYQNSETLMSLEFVYCRLPTPALNEICDSLYTKGAQIHGIQFLSFKFSRILESNSDSVPTKLLSLLSSGRSLQSLRFHESHLGPKFAKMVFNSLLDSSSSLSTLELSDCYIAGWLSQVHDRFSSCSTFSSGVSKSLQSLHDLNLRGNNLSKDDTEDLKSALVYAPNLRKLDISDNLIGDDGIRNLIPYFIGAFGRALPISDLRLENCNLSYNGAAELLMSLSTSKNPLLALSIADNNLGSDVAVPLAKFLETSHVRMLNVEDIDLGSSGFLELCKKIPEELELMHINLSKNRGGIEAAKFVHKLILHAPRLGVVNAGYNFMPEESCAILCDALKLSKGQLERLDLTGNIRCCQSTHVSMLQEFHSQGRPIVILQSFSASTAPYDDDP